MNYIIVSHNRDGSIVISAEYNNIRYEHITYYYYSKRAAIAKYRRDNDLKYKHLEYIEY